MRSHALRFDAHAKQVVSIPGLLPVRFLIACIRDIDFSRGDLPNADVIDEELYVWKFMWYHLPYRKDLSRKILSA